ncbi:MULTISPECIES: tetratricopeptide repeat protein [unclassified Parafrankia]|uniref:tetratricopeptide repeat protein n=1 Tax=unclassified Parafrankia TaxID=2994368 RepID=UPI001F3F8831|nr:MULTISPECIES: tetratricopeptide repeat protein [unclassified Parafrankia]
MTRVLTGGRPDPREGVRPRLPATRATGEWQPAEWNVPRRDPFFVGRDALLQRIHRELRPPGAGRGHDFGRGRGAGRGRNAGQGRDVGRGRNLGLVSARGAGGMGASRLAVEYAHRHAGDYGLVWWVDADTPERAESCLAELAAAIAPPGAGHRAAVLRRLWAELGQRTDWLLIYDGVGDPRDLTAVAPPDSGRLLVTSRGPAVARLTPVLLEVGELRRDESVLLLRQHHRGITPPAAETLAGALADVPFAVALAGRHLAATDQPAADYLALLGREAASDPVAAAVAASRARLDVVDPAAAGLLDQVAFLAADPLTLTRAPAGTAAAAARLDRLGLADWDGATIRVHGHVQALVRRRLAGGRRPAALLGAQRLLVCAYLPGRDPADPASWPSLATLDPHIRTLTTWLDDECADFRRLVLRTARYLAASARYEAGERLTHQARALWGERLGPDHPDTLAAADLEASIRADGFADHDTARALLGDVHARRVRVLGEQHRDTLHSAWNLARAAGESGDHDESARLLRDTVARQRAELGPDDRDTLRSAHSLGHALTRLGEYGTAHDLLAETLARRGRTSGAAHPDTVWTAAVLGVALRGLGRGAHARDLHTRALAGARARLGDEHPLTLYAALHLALDLAALGAADAGRDLFTEVIGWDVVGWRDNSPAGPRTWVVRWARGHQEDIRRLWSGS